MLWRLTIILAYVFASINTNTANAQEGNHTDNLLVFGSVVRSTYLRNISDEEVNFSAVYKVRLNKLESLHGEYSKKYLDIELPASNAAFFKRKKRILVYIEYDESKNISYVDWWRIQNTACVSKESIGIYHIENVFEGAIKGEDLWCIYD